MTQATPPSRAAVRAVPRRSFGRLWMGKLALVALLTSGGLAGALWWEDRPLRRIESLLAHQEYGRALDESQAYLARRPDRSQAQELKARALAGVGNWAEAARVFDRVGAATLDSQRAWSQALIRLERWSEALPLLTELHTQRPKDADVLHELAACHAKLGDFAQAVILGERLIELPEQDVRGRVLLGAFHNNQGNYRKAAEVWKPILDADPEARGLQLSPAEFLLGYGRALSNDGRSAEAIPWLEKSLAAEPSTTAAVLLGVAFENEGDLPRAEAIWREAVARDARSIPLREGLARAALQRRATDEAFEWLAPIAHRPDLTSSAAYLFQRAWTLAGDQPRASEWEARVAALRKLEDRQETIEQGLLRVPHSFWSRAVRAQRFAEQGNLREAAQLLEGLLLEKPDEPFVEQLARAIHGLGPVPSLDLVPMKQF